MRFTDRVTVGEVKETKEGYLVATARVARTGNQLYLASELGDVAIKAGFKPDDIVRVHRHPDQVFADATLNSITRVPVTLDHPPEEVRSDNWARYSKGEVGDAYSREAEWIVVNPMVKDAEAVQAARTTHKEISMGYAAEVVAARDGVDADFEMRNIIMNHLALVPKGRAGEKARIGDSWGINPVTDHKPGGKPRHPKEGGRMTTKTVVLGDKAVQVLAEDAAEVERFKDASAKQLADAQSTHDAAIAAKDAELAKLQAKLDDAESKIMSDADLDKRVADRAALVGAAKAIVGDIKTEGLSDADIRKAVVTAKLGDAAVADKSEAYIDARFDILVEDSAKDTGNPVRDAIKSVPTNHQDANLDDARSAYLDRLTRQTKEA